MSRRERGRFSTHTATETLQRQLTAPAHKWRKAWVAPSGLQPESSYKVCKWVRMDDKDLDDETNGIDGEDDDDEGDHDDDEEENDEEKEDGQTNGEAKLTSASTPAETTLAAAPDTAPAPTPTPALPTAAAAATDTASDTEPAKAAETAGETPAEPPTVDAPATEPVVVDVVPSTDQSKPSPLLSQTADVPMTDPQQPDPPAHEHTAIPPNAIEMTNTAPGHTEVGHGDLGAETAGIEITHAEKSPLQPEASEVVAAPVEVGSLGQNEDKMDVDEPVVEKGEAPEVDAGLVMGEIKPPAGQEGLSVTDQDEAREAEPQVQAADGATTPEMA